MVSSDPNNNGQHTFLAKKVLAVLWYFDVAESENDFSFSELALLFEMFHIFKNAKSTQILTLVFSLYFFLNIM